MPTELLLLLSGAMSAISFVVSMSVGEFVVDWSSATLTGAGRLVVVWRSTGGSELIFGLCVLLLGAADEENSLPTVASRVERTLLEVVGRSDGVVGCLFSFSAELSTATELARVTCLVAAEALDALVTGSGVVVLVVVVVVRSFFGGSLQQLRTKYPLTQTPIG